MDIRLTSDGSLTIFSEKFQETYHSMNGAITESNHVFISSGLGACSGLIIKVLEIGFGTGLNALLTYNDVQKKGRRVDYKAIELYPLDVSFLNHLEGKGLTTSDISIIRQMHETPWEETVELSKDFFLTKEQVDLTEFMPGDKFDVVFFDAFSPVVQPELWTEGVFKKMFECMNPKGILVTYCAKGSVRRAMLASGFKVERLPGPPGKREMLRAKKS